MSRKKWVSEPVQDGKIWKEDKGLQNELVSTMQDVGKRSTSDLSDRDAISGEKGSSFRMTFTWVLNSQMLNWCSFKKNVQLVFKIFTSWVIGRWGNTNILKSTLNWEEEATRDILWHACVFTSMSSVTSKFPPFFSFTLGHTIQAIFHIPTYIS